MIRKSTSNSPLDEDDNDPMTNIVNMVDIMLVLAVGFLLFAIISQGITSVDVSSQDSSQSQSMQEAIDVNQGREISEDDFEYVNSSGSGYSQVGQVYRDPETGKLVMVSN